MTTKKPEINIENEVTAKLRFEYLAGLFKSNAIGSLSNKKSKTNQNDELNFYIPEKWKYDLMI